MNNIIQPNSNSDAQLNGLRTLTMVIYVLYAVSALVGITALVAIIINYVKRDETRGTVYESHFTWQIRTFWWGLLWAIVGVATVWLLVGFAILAANSIWLIYRVVRGFLNWNDGRAMPA